MTDKKRIIVTSALPYSEAMPHLGNLVGSMLPADIFYKYTKLAGYDSIYICGSDQHGTPIELRAIKLGKSPEELSDSVHNAIKMALEAFECTFTYYGKTNSESNKETVYELFEALNRNGYILAQESVMPFCRIDKRFLTDRLIEGTCPYCGFESARGDQCDNCGRLLTPQELIEPHCTLCHGKEIEFRKTKNLAIDLKKLQPDIEGFVKSRAKNNWSKNAVNKTLSYLEQGLQPREITRDMKWGFPVPLKGFEDKVFYVWFDAVIGYIGITREWSEDWKGYWKDPDTRLVQFMGKDNIEFHTMMWPAILIGSDSGYVLPSTIIAYEYLNSHGLKFSKSRGIGSLNIENAPRILEPDYWRFALSYLLPETADTEFTIAGFVEIINKVMNDKIGNFVHRVLTISKSNRPLLGESMEISKEHIATVQPIVESYIANFESFKIREALKDVIRLAEAGNEIMSNRQPWALAKAASGSAKAKGEFAEIIGSLAWIVHAVGIMLWPFAPAASTTILSYFSASQAKLSSIWHPVKLGSLEGLNPVFNKVTDEQLRELEKFESD
ncbi:methionine--tRNA ligase [Candidatus Marsarchaeota archaeon]|nr:methionine--tRNA ligase [Candidatus Marsarchaeota archaeon]MCL5405009.1 methionine--tRNA ligase [Candidatus Marsarchaeota archaeon]